MPTESQPKGWLFLFAQQKYTDSAMNMQAAPLSIRNIGILAHIDAGKTSITERVLHVAGVREKPGNVDEGTTATDYLTIERQHGITIKTAAVRFLHKGVRFHLLDTPGHVDFSAEVDRVLRVLDGAVIVLCAVSGVQVRTGFIASGCRAHKIPRMYFINKMDRRGADFFAAVQEIAGELGESVLPLQVPTFEGHQWNGIADLVNLRWFPAMLDMSDENVAQSGESFVSLENIGLPIEQAPISEESQRQIEQYRERIVDRASMYDDKLTEMIVEGQQITPANIRDALRPAILRQDIMPVLCGSSFSDISTALLLDAVIDYFPDPLERGCPPAKDLKNGSELNLPAAPDAPFSAYIFKSVLGQNLEPLGWLRIWSGTIREGMKVMAMPARKHVQIQRLYGVNGADIEHIESAAAGEIVGAMLSSMEAGGTLCAPNLQIIYESFKTPEPLVYMVIEPSSQAELPRLREALKHFSMEDISLSVSEEKDTGRITIAGQGELHLEIIRERLKKEYGLRVRAGNPQVPKIERLKKSARLADQFVGDFGGERLAVGLGIFLENEKDSSANSLHVASGIRLSANYEACILRAMETVLAVGPSEGWPIVGTKVVVESFMPPGGAAGSADKRLETAVEAAASSVLRKAVNLAGTVVLVPIVQVSVEVPDDWFGSALASLQARGARIEAVEDTGGVKSIVAYAPMEHLFGYATSLRSITEGRGVYQAKFDHYGSAREY